LSAYLDAGGSKKEDMHGPLSRHVRAIRYESNLFVAMTMRRAAVCLNVCFASKQLVDKYPPSRA
jgi:hypothetical protein